MISLAITKSTRRRQSKRNAPPSVQPTDNMALDGRVACDADVAGHCIATTAVDEERIQKEFQDWLVTSLEKMEIDGEVYAEYVNSIISDEDSSVEERSQSVVDILGSATEADLSFFQKTLVEKWECQANALDELQKVKEKQKQLIEMKQQEEDKKRVEEVLQKHKQEMDAKSNKTLEEIEYRQRIISEYGCSSLSNYDEDGIAMDKKSEKGKDDDDLGVEGNLNKQRVLEYQKSMREQQKAQHEKKVQREKELLAKDKARKELAKRKTQKKEKTRGCG